MCKDTLHPFLAALPKVEHHMHIEGSLSPELLFALAAKNSIALPSPSSSPSSSHSSPNPSAATEGPGGGEVEGTQQQQDQPDPAFASVETLYARYDAFTSLDDFLHYYYIGFRVLRTAEDFEALAAAYFAKVHAANVRHAEIFFDPQVHAARGVPLRDVIAGLTAARRRAEVELGITSILTPCMLRHLPLDDGMRCLEELIAGGYFADGTLGGLGLCSTELDKPPREWKPLFDRARAAGVARLTAHAGEEGPAAFVVEALDELGVQRIDHGIRAAEDDEVLRRVARDGVLMSVCPVSNWRLKCVPSVAEVPIRKLLDAGVKFSINSDDPAYFGGYIQENYCAVQESIGLSVQEWAGIARAAVEGSWCENARKEAILADIEAVTREWASKSVSVA